MPVWHAATEELRQAEDLLVIGITQEQHPQRCRLFAQWQGFEWPILWDPLNLTGASAVPGVFAVDEFGVIRKARLDPRRIEDELIGEFLAAPFEPEQGTAPVASVTKALLGLGAADTGVESAYARLLWNGAGALDGVIRDLEAAGLDHQAADPSLLFRAGVAYRMRYDSQHARGSDFQSALDLWSAALQRDPNQYIWRRRIQQYGPRLDKPYPFYDWIERAQREVSARGVEPVQLRVPLSGAEIAQPSKEYPTRKDGRQAPDPERLIDLDGGKLVAIDAAAAVHTASAGARVRQRPSARVHLALRPDPLAQVHWTNEAGPTVIWVAVPQGWRIERNLFELPVPDVPTSREVRRLDFEVTPPEGWQGPAKVRGYALYFVCESESGECLYRRQDFVVPISAAGGTGAPSGGDDRK
ncbi:MAG: hypothetical protein ACI8QZ_003122 [Chlamydiales bacterium]